MAATADKEAMTKAYLDVRDDKVESNWTVFKYEDKNIVHAASGTDYEEFRSQFGEGERAYGYVRVETGDELSKRAKFAFITWIGESVPALQKAKVSTDKATVKQVIQCKSLPGRRQSAAAKTSLHNKEGQTHMNQESKMHSRANIVQIENT